MSYGDGWENRDKMQQAADPLPTYIQKAPELNHITSGVVVPLLQAVVTGILCGVAALAVTAWFKMPFWAIGGTAAAVIMAGSWLSYRSRWQMILESIFQVDLNHDGRLGNNPIPAPQLPASVRVELIQDEGRKGDFIDLPAAPAKLKALASGLINQQRQFALTLWTGNGQLFSRSEFEQLRAAMIERGLAKWKKEGNPNQGVDLTPQGMAVMRYLASNKYQPPSLPNG